MNISPIAITALADLMEVASACEIVEIGEFRHIRLTQPGSQPVSYIQGLVTDTVLRIESSSAKPQQLQQVAA
jgi:hypothetical protein